jgi:hypothetical protein
VLDVKSAGTQHRHPRGKSPTFSSPWGLLAITPTSGTGPKTLRCARRSCCQCTHVYSASLNSIPEYETVGSACRSTFILVALGKCNLWLRISVCVDIIAFDQHVVRRYVVYVVSRPPAFTPVDRVQSCAVANATAAVAVCCLPCLIKTPSVFPFFFTLPRGVTVGGSGFEGREVFSRWFCVVIFKYSLGDLS